MALAVARGSMQLDVTDVEEADLILTATEARMSEALGEYGLSPIAVARQKMLEFIRYAGEPVNEKTLWAVMRRDMKGLDFSNSLNELINANKIVITSAGGTRFYAYKDEVVKMMETLDDDAVDVLLAGGKADIPKLKIN